MGAKIKMNEELRIIELEFVNAYLLKTGEAHFLIDSGLGQYWPKLENALTQAGCLPDHLKLVILTHGDIDHSGNCAELQRKYQVRIAMHAGDVEMVKSGLRLKRHAHNLLGELFLFLGRGMGGNFQKFQPDILLEDGQDLSPFGLDAKVIHTPGHTRGSIAILTASGLLFPGDTLSNRRKPGAAGFIENDQEMHSSLERLKGLEAHTIYPGHGKPFAFEELASIQC
jgi:glyoxylase-like metal-dependent hydrolase (beta-lactamase superfamily II)